MRANDSTRRDPVVVLIVASLLVACCAVATMFERIDPIEPRAFVVWRSAVDARRIAHETRRPILFAFVEERDAESAQFERALFGDANFGARLNREFVPVRLVDRGRRSDPAVNALASRFGVGRFPALVVTDADGGRRSVLTSQRPRAELEAFLRDATRIATTTPATPRDDAYIEALSRIGGASSPSFSPDGTRIAFVSDLSGMPQLWVLDRDDGFPELVATDDDGIRAAQWSPDGQWIAFAAGGAIHVVRPDGTARRRLTPAAAQRTLMSRWTRDGLLPVSVLHATATGMETALVDPNSGAARVVAQSAHFAFVTDVSCDGKRALLLERDGAQHTTRIAGEKPRVVARAKDAQMLGVFDAPCPRPLAGEGSRAAAGEGLLAVSNVERDKTALVRQPLTLRAARAVPLPRAGEGVDVLWSRDDAELTAFAVDDARTRAALVWNRAGRDELGLYDLRTGARELGTLPIGVIRDVSFSRDGTQLVFAGSDARCPADIWLLDVATKRLRRLTRSAHAGVDLAKLAKPELMHFRGADGLPLTGWLYRAPVPNGAAVISLHGGPSMQETTAMSPTYQALAANGISVFAPNVRGSYGFGRRFLTLDDGARREQAIGDVKAAADFLLERRIASPRRLAVMGESYGGWLALAAATRHPSLFARVVDIYGMTDLRKMIDEATPDVAAMLRAEYGDDALLARLTPDLTALNAPTLVLHGARDTTVRPSHSNALVAALRARRVPVEYVLFNDEAHGFKKLDNRVRATASIVEWLVKL